MLAAILGLGPEPKPWEILASADARVLAAILGAAVLAALWGAWLGWRGRNST